MITQFEHIKNYNLINASNQLEIRYLSKERKETCRESYKTLHVILKFLKYLSNFVLLQSCAELSLSLSSLQF